MKTRFRRVGILALVTMASISPLRSQEAASPLPGVFSEVLDVRVVNLEVVVTDKDGVPIRGLGPGDFVLTIDGTEVPIEYFSEVRAGVAAPVSATQREMGVAELPTVVPGDPVETSYLVFIDEYFAIARDRDKVLRALIEDLPRLGPNDRMAIVAFNGEDLEMLTTWSQSIPALERTLEEALERPVYGLRRLAEQRQYDYDKLLRAAFEIRNDQRDGQRFLRSDLLPDERFFLERLTDQIRQSVTAATLTMRSFAMPPGRKVMLLYSGGWPFFPITFLGDGYMPLIPASNAERGNELFEPLTDTANLLGYTLYPVDMPGFDDLLASAIEPTALSRVAPPVDAGTEVFRREQEIHLTLTYLAKETGGRAFLNEERLTALDEAISDTRSYYWLGFSPQRDWDDTRHRVDVGLRQPGFRVRARSSYRDSSKQFEVAMALESTLMFGSPVGSESLLVEVGQARKTGRKRMVVPISVLIPLAQVTFIPDGEGQTAQLELQIAVRDSEGRRAQMPVVPVVMRSDTEPQPGVFGRYDTTLRMRNMPHKVVLGIYDLASGRILSQSVEITP